MVHSFSSFSANPFYVDSISDPKQVLEAAKKNLRFTNGNANYAAFGEQYAEQYDKVCDDAVAKTCLGRKIWVIPNIAIGIIKTISHLAFFLFLHVLKAPSVTKYKYCMVRDLEEVYGNFIAVFNDKLGLYHIQQAQFQKKCYYAYSPEVKLDLPEVKLNLIYEVPLFPQDIWNEILSKSHLHLVTLSCVSHSVNELTKTYAEKITPEGCFGIEKWKKYKVDADAKSVPKIPLKML